MDVLARRTGELPLRAFCKHFLHQFGREKFFNPELLAAEFLQFFGLSAFLTLHDTKRFLLTVGITQIKPYSPVGKGRGLFGGGDEHMTILYKQEEGEEGQMLTILHELREILGAVAEDIDSQFIDVEGDGREDQADAFALGSVPPSLAPYFSLLDDQKTPEASFFDFLNAHRDRIVKGVVSRLVASGTLDRIMAESMLTLQLKRYRFPRTRRLVFPDPFLGCLPDFSGASYPLSNAAKPKMSSAQIVRE